MSPALVRRVRSLLPQARLFLMYGQTEATARLSYLPPERLMDKPGSVGVAIPGVQLEVRGQSNEQLPPGVTGEIWARGPNVMQGYWRDESATGEVLVEGWLRTGDTGHMDAEGFLFLDGRRSDIIKVGAHRVLPRDIEAVIEELEGVQEVAVVGIEDEVLGQTVKACIVRTPHAAPVSESAVKGHCRMRLAAYKIPRVIEFLDALPRTSSGKVRRQLLRSDAAPAMTS
jgi:acyl-CoA synthetase (AMP-forming)/AMP-acid ligase II